MSRTVRKTRDVKSPRVVREGWQVAKDGMPRSVLMHSRVHGVVSNRTARRKGEPGAPRRRGGRVTDELTKARYIRWAKGPGPWHVARIPDDGTLADSTTACGQDVPEQVYLAHYANPRVCTRCKKADPEAVELAEQTRKRDVAQKAEMHEASLERTRRGEFTVYRCATCGQQARDPQTVDRPGSIVCTPPGGRYHDQRPEPVVVHGPAWLPPA